MPDLEHIKWEDSELSLEELYEAIDLLQKAKNKQDTLSEVDRNILVMTYGQIKGYFLEEIQEYNDHDLVDLVSKAIDAHIAANPYEVEIAYKKTEALELDIPNAYYLEDGELDQVALFVNTLSETERFLQDGLDNTDLNKVTDEEALSQIRLQLHILTKLKTVFLKDFRATTKSDGGDIYFNAGRSEYVSDILELFKDLQNNKKSIQIIEKCMLNAAGDDNSTRGIVKNLAVNLLKQFNHS